MSKLELRPSTRPNGPFLSIQIPAMGIQPAFHQLREEKRIAFRIFPSALGVILTGVELLPYTCRKDVLVPLIPPSIDYLRDVRVVVCAFETGIKTC